MAFNNNMHLQFYINVRLKLNVIFIVGKTMLFENKGIGIAEKANEQLNIKRGSRPENLFKIIQKSN